MVKLTIRCCNDDLVCIQDDWRREHRALASQTIFGNTVPSISENINSSFVEDIKSRYLSSNSPVNNVLHCILYIILLLLLLPPSPTGLRTLPHFISHFTFSISHLAFRISHYERHGIFRCIGGLKSGFFISSSLFL